MAKHKHSQSVRKFVRREKARLRAADTEPEEYKQAIQALYRRFSLNRPVSKKPVPEMRTIS